MAPFSFKKVMLLASILGTANAVRVGEDRAEAALKQAQMPTVIAETLAQQLPPGPRICILGGTRFQDPDSEILVKALAEAFAENLAGKVVVLTGGMPGVQETFAKSLGSRFPSLVNLLPAQQQSNYGVGVDVTAGADLPARMEIFGNIGQIYICVEGGPGVAKEAKVAFERGALVVPLLSSGGASSGMFDFPPAALRRPSFVTAEQWACLARKRSPEEAAKAVVEIVRSYMLEQMQEQSAQVPHRRLSGPKPPAAPFEDDDEGDEFN